MGGAAAVVLVDHFQVQHRRGWDALEHCCCPGQLHTTRWGCAEIKYTMYQQRPTLFYIIPFLPTYTGDYNVVHGYKTH